MENILNRNQPDWLQAIEAHIISKCQEFVDAGGQLMPGVHDLNIDPNKRCALEACAQLTYYIPWMEAAETMDMSAEESTALARGFDGWSANEYDPEVFRAIGQRIKSKFQVSPGYWVK